MAKPKTRTTTSTKEADCRVLVWNSADIDRERVWGVDLGPGPRGVGRRVELRNSPCSGGEDRPVWGDVIHAVPIVESDGYHEPLSYDVATGTVLERYTGSR